ncbi:CIA30 family protein [Colwelliaceae bacterium 6471]
MSISSDYRAEQTKPADENTTPMINFNLSEEIENWSITNDSVMGGKSVGSIVRNHTFGEFSGTISRENNGGFSSVYRTIEPLKQPVDMIELNLQGDGHTYQVRIICHIDGYRLAYKHDFATEGGRQEKLRLNFDNFQATFRGRILDNAPPIQVEHINEVGFLITKSKPGPFALLINSLSFL